MPLSDVVGAVPPWASCISAGIVCSISTDDPEMFDTDLTREYEAVRSFGLSAGSFFDAGVRCALCDEQTRARLRGIGESYDWSEVAKASRLEAI